MLSKNIIKAFTFLITIVYSSISWSCIVPIYGEEIDNLIILKKNEEVNSYNLEVPKKLDGTGSAKIYLYYSKVEPRGNRIAKFTKQLNFRFNWNVVSGDFVAPDKEGYVSYIQVVWPGELCDTLATSINLNNVE